MNDEPCLIHGIKHCTICLPVPPCHQGTVPEVGHSRLCIEPKGHDGLHRAYFNEKRITWGIPR